MAAPAAAPAATPKQDNSAKFVECVRQVTGPMEERLTKHIVVVNEEVLQRIGEVEARLLALEGLVAGAKKATRKPEAEAKADGAPADGKAAAAAPAKKFPGNSMLWNKQMFPTSEEYRTKYYTAEIKAAVEKAAPELAAMTPEKKLAAETTAFWALIKKDAAYKTTLDALQTEYDKLKAEDKAAKPQEQLVAEPVTPPAEAAK